MERDANKELVEQRKKLMMRKKRSSIPNSKFSNYPDVFLVQHSNVGSNEMPVMRSKSKIYSSGRSKDHGRAKEFEGKSKSKARKTTEFGKHSPNAERPSKENWVDRNGVPYDAFSKPLLPINLGVLEILSLGRIIHDRPAYHSAKYLYPVGFRSVRDYISAKDTSKR